MRRLTTTVAIGALGSLLLAGCASDHSAGTGDHKDNSAVPAGARQIAMTGDAFRFGPDRIEVTEGEPIAISFTSKDIRHDVVVDAFDLHAAADRSQTAVGGFTATKVGEFEIYCSEVGHKDAGMVGKLTVVPRGTPTSVGSTPAPKP